MTETGAFPFAFDPGLQRWAGLFGITSARSAVIVSDEGLEVRYGPWTLVTPWANVAGAERTGPYQAWRVAGPARMSLADRGVSFVDTTAGGVCVAFHEPVRAIEPFGLFHHPAATVGVADIDGFVAALDTHRTDADPSSSHPGRPRPSVGSTLQALWHWYERRRSGGIVEHERDVAALTVPGVRRPDAEDDQPIDDGAGPRFHRRYRVGVAGPAMTAEEAMVAIQADPNVVANQDFTPFNKVAGRAGSMSVEDRYVVDVSGPWSGTVEVVEVAPRMFRLATLESHMEAGVIELRVDEVDGCMTLTIESWARSGGRIFDALYDKLGLGKALQSEMWVIACERFVKLVGGDPVGPVEVTTERERTELAPR